MRDTVPAPTTLPASAAVRGAARPRRRPRPAPGEGSSVTRAFDVLDLFSPGHPLLRHDDLQQQLGYSRSTAYRYIRELCDAGFLAPTGGGHYALGPRVVELELLLRRTDPLYLAARHVLPAHRTDASVLMVQNLYGDKVLCIHAEGPEALEHAGRRVPIQRTRGMPFPLFRGAASLALLAWMPADRIRELYVAHAAEIARQGLAEDWEGFRAHIAAVRRRGYATSSGSLATGLSAVAVPIVVAGSERRVIGSLVRVVLRDPGGDDEAAAAERATVLQAIARQIALEFQRTSRAGQASART